jgi:acetyl-CoA synthetase
MPPDHPIFGRDVPDAAWRPTPELLRDSRLARFLRTTGEPDLEALQARAVADPGWFWGAAADDISVAWQRRPERSLDLANGAPWADWWIGGGFNHAVASVEPRAAADPTAAIAWGGEMARSGGRTPGLRDVVDAAPDASGEGVRAGRPGRDLPADAVETAVAVLPSAARGDLHLDLPVRRAGGRPARRREARS